MAGPMRVLLALLAPMLAGAAVGGYYWFDQTDRTSVDNAPKGVVQRGGASLKFTAASAASYGIRTRPAAAVVWQKPAQVYGRVVPNPQATVEVRAPFAGVVKPATGQAWPRLGDHVTAQQALGILETRLTPAERIDLRAKSAEAQAKHQGAEAALTIQEERVKQLDELKRTGAAALREFHTAQLLLLEARTQRNAARDQWHVYREALAAPEGKSISVPLIAPLDGEVTELAAQPGLAVEPGSVLIRLVDFRRGLVRLEFPVVLAHAAPPHEVGVAVATGDAHASPVPAFYTGSAPQVEPASQRVTVLYALDTPAGAAWRPGLFIRGTFPDPAVKPVAAVAVPASAILYHQGRTLVYVHLPPDRFERHEVEILGRDGEAVVVREESRRVDDWANGVRAGWLIVDRNAQVLLSEEFRRDTDDDD
jgi:biotin carboxyl carrier protein